MATPVQLPTEGEDAVVLRCLDMLEGASVLITQHTGLMARACCRTVGRRAGRRRSG